MALDHQAIVGIVGVVLMCIVPCFMFLLKKGWRRLRGSHNHPVQPDPEAGEARPSSLTRLPSTTLSSGQHQISDAVHLGSR